ncbi:glycosyltransferase family 4 protein [Methylobacter marinus]|uniref:glycosyltransferase family 4 protein n=1 Tax=Methylobacter marinus TaxID=34058 RepID=UPI00039EDC4B|nr:glycosyltransferase family 1 protein [Methylobacter marinus]
MKAIVSIDPVHFPLTGIGRYTFELARHLNKLDDICDLKLLSGSHFVSSLPEAKECVDDRRASLTRQLKKHLLKSHTVVDLANGFKNWKKQRTLLGLEDFVFHGPNYYLPEFAGVSISTFHDLSVYSWAHCHPPERVRFMQKQIVLSLRRADMLITDSEFTRQEVAQHFSWPLDRIRSVSLASSAEFYPRNQAEWSSAGIRYSLTMGGYALFAGTIEPRKNLDVLLDAYMLLPLSLRQRWPLVMTGYQGWRSEKLHERIKAANREGWVRYLGYVPAEDLPLLYAGARLFVFPSLYEGFGLPVLEAMASGVPVVCSNSSSLPEVAGDAAGVCEATDVDSLSELIARGLEDETWRNRAIEKGLARAAQFSWDRCAKETVAVYREAISGRS